MRAASEQHAASVQENTLATAENTAASIGGVARALGKAVSETAGSGIAGVGLPALIAGLVGALAGNSSPDAVTLPVLTQPASIQVEAALPSVEQPNFTPVATGQGGLSRRATTETTSPAAVTIQVNAMDSRSFLDHSDEIARAVRHALLNTHSLRDVVGEL